jgi:hypothetical protein
LTWQALPRAILCVFGSLRRVPQTTAKVVLPHGEASREDAGRALKAAETIMYQVKTAYLLPDSLRLCGDLDFTPRPSLSR